VDYLTKVLGLTEGLIEMNKIISQSLGVDDILGYKCFVQILPTLDNLIKLTKVLPDWFDSEKFKNTQKTIQEAKIRIKSYNESIDSICKEFEKGILSVDYQGIYARFKTEYTSVFRIFNSNYKTDKNQIRSLYKTIVKKMDDKFVIKTLDKLRSIEELKQWIDENNGDLVSMLGEYYNKEHTDFEYIENAINLFNDISNHFSGKVPIKLRELILSGNKDTIKHIYNKLKVIIDEELLDRVDTTLSLGRRADDLGLEELKVHLSKASQELQGLINSYDKMSVYAKDKTNIDNIVQGICKLSEMQEISKQIENKAEELKKNYEFLYNGINTDWEVILDSLTWARDFKNTVTTCENKRKFVEKICSDEVDIANSEKYHNVMQDKLRAVESEWKWYLSLFEEDKDFNNTSIFALVDRIEKCANGLSLLEEWIDFRNSREMCKEEGLDEYIDKVETMGIEAKHIVPIFSKRFYRLWLDAALLKFPSVLNFRTRVHQETINEFASLDKLQLEIARARVRKTLIDKLPNVDKFTSGKDEISILKRELNKQRKIMPLRKLFKEIPNLILTLKPCLMMSPLSVSLFLEAESYNFDVVVFDEASQVCTEDAIGAILRGSQVIIAGDSKQLPPTSFFTASTSDDEMYDTDCDDEQEDDANAYESILDEAGLLPERTLLWHYRSRHEHLIAFSNAKIYKNNLITFPSNIDKIPDNGVEFVYVKEGYYDRGGKKGNVAEAKRVAELVFEHFKKFPGRSLGVIAFGEVQQQAIDYAIRQIRVKSQQFESFFNEDKEDAFFVKNLENVQGDERDTIIFSIGYAKDAAGKMYMNFGPLSKGGGERRLNVAITRAKYNVKLVGSIMPTDIEIEKISSEGPKLLRSYIDFAINGPASILRETSESQHAEHDSTFEEAVYKFLDRKGYKIGTQVGCSGYRIDMTVKHPTISGRYVLGIECDGAAYHSARTARERDRLRQAVLEDMGWKIYRIWSTDWIKDPVTEGQKLLNAVESAIAEYTEKDIGCSDNNEKQVSDFLTFENISINESKGHRQDNIYGFEYYKESLVRTVSRDPEDAKYIANVIQYVVDNEGPINFELICKRIACLFGNQKATIKVRSSAEYVLKNYLVDFIVKKGDFCYSKNDPTVKVRIPDPNSEIRPINYISIEEIAEAMFVIAGKYVGITSEGLYAETARAFGFNRTGANIVPAMKNACEYLIESGRAKEIGEKIIINNL
ncbi:MAG TPA: DNA/RNA helicase, partial [Clostridiales bacterium]|nr:DNA/RNA helicase [Clostridiales bacterium]